ncbi:tyrosine-type recombinase/integrase [Streptomyces monomycini]|uniref:tyrosine-type recombinase/integrase n=1 Tax=Streptomyces monomycini TaxID=371720 RepID=UPI0004AA64A4|nr:site-specific integrase [Streptomyces monomycini]
MAYIRRRQSRGGKETFRVIWREDGKRDGRQEGEDFDDETSAERFRDLVNGHGQQWPTGWTKGVGFADPEADKVPEEEMFGTFAHRYIDHLTGIGGQTRGNYRKFVDNHMLPWFRDLAVRGDRPNTLNRDHISQWVNDLEDGRRGPHHQPGVKRRAYAPKTIRNYHGLLFGILQAAVDADKPLRVSNPCIHTNLPEDNHTADEATFLEREEYALVRCHLAADVVDLVDLLVGTGLRWGEISALQPRDLTLHGARPKLRVQRAWKRGEHGKFLGAPKTKKSRRTIVLSPSQVSLLKRNTRGKDTSDFVFTAPEGNAWDSGGFYTARWKPAIASAAQVDGLTKKPRIHDLRHTHASWLIAQKVPLPAIQARLGHESITTTVDRYGHLLAIMDEEIIAAVEWGMQDVRLVA